MLFSVPSHADDSLKLLHIMPGMVMIFAMYAGLMSARLSVDGRLRTAFAAILSADQLSLAGTDRCELPLSGVASRFLYAAP
jgi:hypothetical protein